MKEQLELTEAELAKINTVWVAEWKAVEILPKSPREMRAWVQNQTVLAGRVADIREHKAKTGELKTRIDTLCRQLSKFLVALGEPQAGGAETLVQLLVRSRKAADQAEKAHMKRERLLMDLSQHEEELLEVTFRVEKTEKAMAQWRSQWADAILPLGLKEDATPAQALGVLEDLKNLFDKLNEAEVLRKRVQGIDRDAEAFNSEVSGLIINFAQELAKHPSEQAAVELHVRLTRAFTRSVSW